jgi:thiol:disulfide interchange protein
MESFRQLMAFPLYLSSVWLLWVIGRQAGVDALGWTLLGAVVLAAGLWARGHWPLGRLSALAETGAVLAAVGFAASLPRHGLPSLQRMQSAPRVHSEAYSDARLAELRAQHRTIFVDFTADWCLTCKVNERIALMTPEVRQAFAERNVAWLVADWTDGDPAITHVLSHYGRPGVPLYLVYAAGGSPQVLPQLLTPGIVVGAVGGSSLNAPSVGGTS